MEKHMMKFGNSSLAIIVPKKWIDKNGLDTSSQIRVSENANGDLVISSREEPVREREEVVESDRSQTAVERLIGLHYMFGTTRLRLYFRNGSGKAWVKKISEMVKEECPGFEIISHSVNDIVIEDFNNIRDVDIWKILGRLKLIIKQEFREIDEEDMKGLDESERLINRFYMLGVRHVNLLGTDDAIRYFVILQMLEMISDNLNILCQPHGIKNRRVIGRLEEQFDACFAGLGGKTESVERSMALREKIYSDAGSLRLDALRSNAVREITNEISRISEFGLYINRGSNEAAGTFE